MKILIVDDEPFIAEMLRHCLVAEGHEVETLTLFDELLEAVEQYDADALILDYWIPGGDVRETLKALDEALGGAPPFVIYSKFGVPHMAEFTEMLNAGIPAERIVCKRDVTLDVPVILDALQWG
jgi:DNA-binding NtrC family response regulator